MKIVFDTNIYLASTLFDGLCLNLVEACLGPKSEQEVFISKDIWKEFADKVIEKRLGDKAYLPILQKSLEKRAIWVEPVEKINIIKDDPADNKILESAVAAHADLIITMDKKHLLKLKQFRGIGIVHPINFSYMLPKD